MNFGCADGMFSFLGMRILKAAFFFLPSDVPWRSILTGNHRMQKGLYYGVSDGLEVISLFLGILVETNIE